MSGEMQRLFVAVPLPADLLSHVECAQKALPAFGGLRLLRPEQLHVTLAFIGGVDEVKAGAAREVVAAVPGEMGGEAVLGGFLLLPSRTKARVVTLEIDDRDRVFAALFETVMGGLEQAGVMQREKRPFRPHLTIARLRVPGPVVPKSECGEAPYRIESVCLYKSELKRDGAVYTVVERCRLEARA